MKGFVLLVVAAVICVMAAGLSVQEKQYDNDSERIAAETSQVALGVATIADLIRADRTEVYIEEYATKTDTAPSPIDCTSATAMTISSELNKTTTAAHKPAIVRLE